MDEGSVDHGIGIGRSAAQALYIFERTALYFRTRGRERSGCSVRASETEHPMTGLDQLSDDGGTYKACGT